MRDGKNEGDRRGTKPRHPAREPVFRDSVDTARNGATVLQRRRDLEDCELFLGRSPRYSSNDGGGGGGNGDGDGDGINLNRQPATGGGAGSNRFKGEADGGRGNRPVEQQYHTHEPKGGGNGEGEVGKQSKLGKKGMGGSGGGKQRSKQRGPLVLLRDSCGTGGGQRPRSRGRHDRLLVDVQYHSPIARPRASC